MEAINVNISESHDKCVWFFFQHTMLQLIKEAGCHNGLTPRDDSPVTEVLNQVCPSTWRGACKTAVQLLFGQAGLVSNRDRLSQKRATSTF